jgi:hypothetical protein
MRLIAYTAVLGWLVAPSLCWMPGGDKEARAIDGGSLFSPSSTDASIDRRSMELPAAKIRGVNLGSLFVFEPWIRIRLRFEIGAGRCQRDVR